MNRSFQFNRDDGTISPKGARHLVLGWKKFGMWGTYAGLVDRDDAARLQFVQHGRDYAAEGVAREKEASARHEREVREYIEREERDAREREAREREARERERRGRERGEGEREATERGHGESRSTEETRGARLELELSRD